MKRPMSRSPLNFLLSLVLAILLVSSAGAQNGTGEMTLLQAAGNGDAAKVGELLAARTPVDGRDGDGRTPLLLATRGNHVGVARLLIEAGADVNAKDTIHDTPFLYAGAEGRDEILKLILATGKANLKDTNRYGGTALIPAADKGHPSTIRILLGTDIDIDHINNLGWTALLEAVILGDGGPVYQEIVGLLVDAGAQNIADRDGKTPLEHARERGFAEIAARIETSLPK